MNMKWYSKYQHPKQTKPKHRQAGFSIVSAIFIVVVLSLIGTYIVSISSLTQTSAIFSMQGTRAYYAAKSGLEWGTYKIAPSATSGGAPPYNCPVSPTTITFAQGGLNGFSTTVTCASSTFTEYGQSYKVFQITSTAKYNASTTSSDYVTRQLYTTVVQPGI